MDLEKYYTPDISEFHVGFGYEFRDGDIWVHAEIDIFDSFTKIHGRVTGFRVKYLDREDIESLGWRFDGRAVDDWFKIESGFDMGSWTCYKMRMHYNYKSHRLFVIAEDIGDNEHVFQGVIKNKSELKRLMVQLGIK